MDFKTALDRNVLIFKMANLELSHNFLSILRSLHSNTKATVFHKEGLTNLFETLVRSRQGCLLTVPLLFALFLNDLHKSE